MNSHFFRRLVGWLLVCVLAPGVLAPRAFAQQPTPPAAPTSSPLPPQGEIGTSDSGELRNRLIFRIRGALEKTDSTGATSKISLPWGEPGGYHWIFLLQVARYPGDNRRLSDMQKGVQKVIEDLVAARKNWPREQVRDTVTLVPYHFNALTANLQTYNLRDFLDNPAPLKQQVPGNPVPDVYQGRRWLDGHDWRASLEGTLKWMKPRDLDPRHAIIVVLDLNSLSQAPQTLENGTRDTASNASLVLPENKARFARFLTATKEAGLDGTQNLENIAVGRLEYDVAVFTRPDLSPLQIQNAPTPTPTQGKGGDKGNGGGGGGGGTVLIIGALSALGLLLVWLFVRPHRFKISDGSNERIVVLSLLKCARCDFVSPGATSRAPASFAVTLARGQVAPENALAALELRFPGKAVVVGGACTPGNVQGFGAVPGALQLRSNRGTFELLSGDAPVASLEVRLV